MIDNTENREIERGSYNPPIMMFSPHVQLVGNSEIRGGIMYKLECSVDNSEEERQKEYSEVAQEGIPQ